MSSRLSDLLLCSQSDERLVSLARAGSERAFVAIVERYRRELDALARRLGGDGRAEDLVQQTFLSAFCAFRSGAEVQHLRGWLCQILRNAASRAPSRAGPELRVDAASIAGEPLEDAVEYRTRALDVLSEIAALPATQRDALVATAVQGRSRAEVAGSMGLSEGAVRQLIYRARATLRSAITAITPCPFARWLAAAGNAPAADRVPEIAAGAGAASMAGVALKLGTLAASGVMATAITPVPFNHHHVRRSIIARPSAHAIGSGGPLRPATDRGIGTVLAAGIGAAHRSVAPTTTARHRASTVSHRSGRDGSSRGSDNRTATGGGDGSVNGAGGEHGRGGAPAAGTGRSAGGDDSSGGSDASGGGGQSSGGSASGGDGGGSGDGTGSNGTVVLASAASSTGDGNHVGTGAPSSDGATSTSGAGSDGQLPASTAGSGSGGDTGSGGNTGSSGKQGSDGDTGSGGDSGSSGDTGSSGG